MKTRILYTIIIAIGVAAVDLYVNDNPPLIPEADPNTVVLELANETFIGTDHGTICIQVYAEAEVPKGLPEPNVPGFSTISVSASGEPGQVIATRLLREVGQ